MKLNLKIWHIVLFIWLVVLILRFERIIELIELLYSYTIIIITDFSFASGQFSLSLADHIAGILILLLIPVMVIYFVKHWQFFNKKIFASAVIIILLMFGFLFAPIISDRNPDFYKDIAVTKLLPPLSTVKEIRLKEQKSDDNNKQREFIKVKNKSIKLPFDESVIYCDSAIISGNELVYYQKGNPKTIFVEDVQPENGIYWSAKLFVFGTDEFGRDIFTRLIYGTRISLFIGFCAVAISFILGLMLGFLAGYKSGWLDLFLNRITDLFLAFPVIFMIIFVLALFGNNMLAVILVLGFSGWMSLFKLVKTEISTIKTKDFFISSKLLGLSPFSLLKKEFLPLILASVIVNIIFQFGNVVLAESALSYLGLGLGNEYSSWGSMIQSGQEYITQSWWMIVLPGVLLILTLLTINDLGGKIKSHFNPRIKYD